jgi:hypothetical protein
MKIKIMKIMKIKMIEKQHIQNEYLKLFYNIHFFSI